MVKGWPSIDWGAASEGWKMMITGSVALAGVNIKIVIIN
jgi:hypothetical protein